jgi:hypothetical protein
MAAVLAMLGAAAIVTAADAQTPGKKAGAKPKVNCAAQVSAKYGNNFDVQTRRMRALAFQRCQQGQPI